MYGVWCSIIAIDTESCSVYGAKALIDSLSYKYMPAYDVISNIARSPCGLDLSLGVWQDTNARAEQRQTPFDKHLSLLSLA